MKYLNQLGIILSISFSAEIIRYFIPLSIPSSIYGIIIMFILLKMKILSVDSIRENGNFLLNVMPIMFVPSAVGLIDSWDILQPVFIPVVTITLVSTVVVMIVAGKITQIVIRCKIKNRNHRK